MNVLDLEQQDIELQLQEIQLKRRMVEIEREKLEKSKSPANEGDGLNFTQNFGNALGHISDVLNSNLGYKSKPVPGILDENLHLHYSNSAKETVMTIVDVTHEGCILVQNGSNASMISRKYNIRSLKWLRNNLSNWSKKQKTESHFWTNIAAKYSRKFLEGDSISRTTIEKLCYLVDSGKMDVWFDKYDVLRSVDGQSNLERYKLDGGK